MGEMKTILLNGVRNADEVSAFSIPVLFQPAGAWILDALPDAMPLCSLDETPFASTAEALAALAKLIEEISCEQVMVIGAPMPELAARDYAHLLQVQEAVGNDVTLLCCESDAQEATSVLRDADGQMCGVGKGTGTRALHAAVFRTETLRRALPGAQSLMDVISAACAQGAMADAVRIPAVTEVLDGLTAYEAQKKLTLAINMRHIMAGVQIFAPESTYIAPDAEIGAGAVILPGCLIRARCKIGAGATIGPNTILEQAEIGAGTSVNSSQVYESKIGTAATVGPFAYVRPGCIIGDHTRIGDFVELKKAQIGDGTKVSHLTYIGDAIVGERVNFGCGTVVVNYDGYAKSQTVIGDDCFIGCNTNLVAPVALGDRVFTAAGTTVTKDVPDGALTVARARQTNLEGWNDRRRERMGQK